MGKSGIDLTQILQDIYDSEINLEISWYWDGGIDIKIQDPNNQSYGFEQQNAIDTVNDAVTYLLENIPKLYPNTEFAKKYGANKK